MRGFYVTDDRNYSYVGARLQPAGRLSTRVLLLVNGHRVNDNVYDQASVGEDFGIDAAMFERVEVIRGPASSLYGTNALFAVVNVVTRTGASINGASFDADAGTLGTELVRGSVGRRLGNGIDFALSGTFARSSGVTQLYLPAFDAPGGNGGLAENLDGEQSGQVYGRFSMNSLTVTGAFGRRLKDVPTASFFTAFNAHDPGQETIDRKATVSAQYVRVLGAARLTTEASLDHFRYDGVYPYANEIRGGRLVGFRRLQRFAAGPQQSRDPSAAGRQTLTIGGESSRTHQDRGCLPFA